MATNVFALHHLVVDYFLWQLKVKTYMYVDHPPKPSLKYVSKYTVEGAKPYAHCKVIHTLL